jgi:hypothetical protein
MSSREVAAVPEGGSISAMSSLAQLDLATLILQPLSAVVEAQAALSSSTVKFIKDFAIDPSTNSLRNVLISTDSTQVYSDANGPILDSSGNIQYVTEQNILNLPVITLLNIPSLSISKFTIDLTIELLTLQDTSSASVDADSDSNWSAGSGGLKTYAKGSSSATSASSSSSQAIKYDLHLEMKHVTPPGLTLLLEFLARNKVETKRTKTKV